MQPLVPDRLERLDPRVPVVRAGRLEGPVLAEHGHGTLPRADAPRSRRRPRCVASGTTCSLGSIG